ncbi:MAG: DNA gyrase subunit B, partial [Pseudomonadales bacterium]|nr:DNA gyrase subunit B [Pseudomonadales bacterium]
LFYPKVSVVNHGVVRDYVFTHDFFQSHDYAEFTRFGESIKDLVKEDGVVRKGDKSESVTNLKAALEWLRAEAMRGQSRQRYKGLGEMNPDQLWETTMDPSRRTMLRVTIEDAIAADHMFNTLMGDQVEPRKDFIVSNALKVANLDV